LQTVSWISDSIAVYSRAVLISKLAEERRLLETPDQTERAARTVKSAVKAQANVQTTLTALVTRLDELRSIVSSGFTEK
jgi:hypothetical protein